MRFKHLSRAAAVLLIAALLPLSAFALDGGGYLEYAEALAPLGVFIGTGEGFALDERPTRIQGLVILVRLLGGEREALAMSGDSIPFTDVPGWAHGYAAYALENRLTQGVSPTLFGSGDVLEPKMFCTFLLRSLGFSDQDGDFEYNSAVEFAYQAGLLGQPQMDEISSGVFLRGQVAKMCCDALLFPVKEGGGTLLDRLLSLGKIDGVQAAIFKSTQVGADGLPDKSFYEMGELAASVVTLTCKYSRGSGVILSSDGLIATSYSIIRGEPYIDITFDDDSVYNGEVYVLDYSEALDLAVIKIDRSDLTPVRIGGSAALKSGDIVYAVSNPTGYYNTMTTGIFSSYGEVFGIDAIEFEGQDNWGTNGGALFDSKGRLVGITFVNGFAAANTGYAVPSSALSRLTEKHRLTPARLIESLVTAFVPAEDMPAYAGSARVPDFGAAYGIPPVERVAMDGFCLYVYDGLTMEHVNEYEEYLTAAGYIYSANATQAAGANGFFNDPAAFVDEAAMRVVVTDVYYYGELLSFAVLYQEEGA